MKRISRLLSILLIVVLLIPTYSFASSDQYDVSFAGTVLSKDALKIMADINSIRVAKGLDMLVWDNSEEDFYIEEAAKLAFYNGSNPSTLCDGTSKKGSFIWCITEYETLTVPEVYQNYYLTNAEEMARITNPDYKAFCGAVVSVPDGRKHFVLKFYKQRTGGDQKYKYNSYQLFTFKASDEYLDCSAYFRTYSTGGEKKYEEYIDKYNDYDIDPIIYEDDNEAFEEDESAHHFTLYTRNWNDYIRLNTFYSSSSNESVVKMDEYGNLFPVHPGIATITVKPAENSNLGYSRTIVVRPKATENVDYKMKKKKVELSWDKLSRVDGYQVYRSTKKKGGYKLIKTIKGSKTRCIDTKAKKGKTYYYKVRGYVKYNSKKYPGKFSKAYRIKVK